MHRALLLALVVLSAGCVYEPTSELTVRPGDHVLLTVGAWDGDRLVWGTLPEGAPRGAPLPVDDVHAAWFVVSSSPVDAGNASALPVGLVESLVGAAVGDVVRPVLAPPLAFGERTQANIRSVPLNGSLPRTTEVPASAVGDGARPGDAVRATPYAADEAWPATALARSNDTWTVRLEPGPGQRGTLVGAPQFCSRTDCLFRSVVTGWNDTAIHVEHRPVLGDELVVLGVSSRVAALNATHVTIDHNHPLAGRTLEVVARVEAIQPPASSGPWRAALFEAPTIDGGRFRLADHAGRVVVIEFFATWCPSCIVNHRTHLPEVRGAWGDEVVIVSVNIDPLETTAGVRAFVDEHGVDWAVVADGDHVAPAYRVGTLSTDVLIGPAGDVVHVSTGELDHEDLNARVADLLAGGAG